MTTEIVRIAQMSTARIGATGTSPLSAIYGKVTNMRGGHVMHPANDGDGPHGVDRYPQRTFSLENYEFDLLDATEQPESIGPVEITMNVYTSMYLASGTLVTAIRQYTGYLVQSPWPAWDRTTDNPRNLEMSVHRLVFGGGADRRTLTKGGAAVYADSRTGEYVTREGGTASVVDHYRAVLVAHGLTVPALAADTG